MRIDPDNRPGVIGCVIDFSLGNERRSVEEALYDLTQEVLADAGLAIDDIDGIVVASNDQYDGRAIAIMAASGSVGGVNRDILSTPSAGEHAFVMGALRVASGQYRTQLVVSWSPTEVSSISEAQRLAADPYFHRPLPLDELSSHALQASALEAAWPGAAELASAIVVKNRRHGQKAYPDVAVLPSDASAIEAAAPLRGTMTEAMVAPPGAGAVALVLASAEFIRERKRKDVAHVQGLGWATESSFLGDRDLAEAPALVAAAAQSYAEAGIDDPRTAFDVAEVADATGYQELFAYEGLGLAARQDWKTRVTANDFGDGGSLPVNLSGGALSFNPVFCTGLIRIGEVANQIRGRAGAHQKRGAKRGVAHAASGFAMQYHAVVVLGREEVGVRT